MLISSDSGSDEHTCGKNFGDPGATRPGEWPQLRAIDGSSLNQYGKLVVKTVLYDMKGKKIECEND